MKTLFLLRIILSIVQNLSRNTNKNVLSNVRTFYAFKVDSYLHFITEKIKLKTCAQIQYSGQKQNHQKNSNFLSVTGLKMASETCQTFT